ncbi:MAG: segregation/condensation protein A [archaeon]|nr:segregation/condensation protein A [archaeon]
MTARSHRKRVTEKKKVDDPDADFEGVELMENPSAQINKTEDMVDLIDQPAWKTIRISLVKRERMDPWNIDVKELAHKYLEKIRSLQSTDLRLPANAILASAILLKFKARALRLSSLEEEGIELRALLTEEELLGGMMPELLPPRFSREGKVTLDMLVESIESILEKTKAKAQKEREGKSHQAFSLPIPKMNLEGKMEEFMDLIPRHADESGFARFHSIVHGRSSHEVIDFFLSLLFLLHEKRVNAWQDDLFGEIMVAVATPGDGENGTPSFETQDAPA